MIPEFKDLKEQIEKLEEKLEHLKESRNDNIQIESMLSKARLLIILLYQLELIKDPAKRAHI